ncbi:hypothetical protein ESCO_000881 [Escovopsis weberi]|uniref:Uncharacterized protein n=1 Tax=Escovopsis weberi TaxID=150374 RepID=A0A0N0RTA1_ESCWE|nr:hypothetical protein ESCO_000881 [Escovopsis weberi]
MTPGIISLELVFGRVYLKQFSPSQVSSESGPMFDPEETTDFLNAADFRQDLVGFSPLLTTTGEDANSIAEMRPSAEAKWRLASTQTFYDFSCIFNDGQRPFHVEVDADTLSYGIQGARQELVALYLHCPRQAWDMKIRVTRSTPLEGMARHESFAKTLVTAMSVSFKGSSLTIGTPGVGRLEGRVESVQVRQIARYLDSSRGASQLCITMVTRMERGAARRSGAGPAVVRGNIWERRMGTGSGAIPCRWFEAAISSTRADKVFDKNRGLELGQVASWDVEQLESGGIVEDVCKPGLRMIEQMDEIGRSNNNEQRLDARDAFHDGLMEQPGRRDQQQYMFW